MSVGFEAGWVGVNGQTAGGYITDLPALEPASTTGHQATGNTLPVRSRMPYLLFLLDADNKAARDHGNRLMAMLDALNQRMGPDMIKFGTSHRMPAGIYAAPTALEHPLAGTAHR